MPNFFLATVLPSNIGMPDNVFYKLLFRSRNYAKHRITRQEKQQPTALRVDATGLAYRPVAYRLTRMTAIRIGWPVTAHGRSREVTNGSFVAAKLTEGPRASAAASGKSGCPVWVDTSSWQDGEAAVRPCLTLERQVTNTLLPDCAIKPPAAEAEYLSSDRRR